MPRRCGGAVSAVSIDDEATRARIRTDFQRYGRIWCPHSAVAAEAFARLPPELRQARRWVLVATAHPAKFREIVEPLIGETVPMPATARAPVRAALAAAPTSMPRSGLKALSARAITMSRMDPLSTCRSGICRRLDLELVAGCALC